MAIGDAAAAAGMALVDGATTDANTIDTEINRSRDYIAEGMGATASPTPLKVAKRDAAGRMRAADPTAAPDVATKGYVDAIGTAALTPGEVVKRDSAGRARVTDPSAAPDIATKGYVDASTQAMQDWVEADKVAKADVVTNPTSGPFANLIPLYDSSARLVCNTPSAANHATPKSYVDGAVAGVSFNGGTVTGQILLPNAFAASSGYTIAYINGDGRISKGASSERYKDHITPLEAAALGNIFPDLYEFVMKDDPEQTPRVGYIAERLHESPDLRRFVVYRMETVLDEPGPLTGRTRLALDEDGEPIPESIDFIALLLAQVAQLHARVAALEAR